MAEKRGLDNLNAANLMLAVGAIVVALAAAEIALQSVSSIGPIRFFVWPAGLRQHITPNEQDTPGISEPHEFIITDQGYRGRPIGGEMLRIAAFGGSTTESLFVPEERSWPRLLEHRLGDALGTTVWIGNFGKTGRDTRQHVLDAKYVLPQFSAQVAVFLVGVNDLGIILNNPSAQPISLEEIQSDEYLHRSLIVRDDRTSAFKLPGLLRGAYDAIRAKLNPELIHVTTGFYRRQRDLRAARVGFTSQIPDLGPFLDEYERNLGLIIDIVRMQGVLPVFVSQASQWAANVPPDVDALFWWGGVDGWPSKVKGGLYYSPEAMDRMMSAYNDRLALVARRKGALFVDAARELAKDRRYFYDQIHYNEAGSAAMAKAIARTLVPSLNISRNSKH